ncbi:MAG: hypothetical protein K2M85_01970 [Paramuribaculum sp.]|nr:hypothetical protein [Paramuribaculum sp.]
MKNIKFTTIQSFVLHITLILCIGLVSSNCQKSSPGFNGIPKDEKSIVDYLQKNKNNLDPIEGIYLRKLNWTLFSLNDSTTTGGDDTDGIIYIFRYKDDYDQNIFLSGSFYQNKFIKHLFFESTAEKYNYSIHNAYEKSIESLPKNIDYNKYWGFYFTSSFHLDYIDTHNYNVIKHNYKKIYPIPH